MFDPIESQHSTPVKVEAGAIYRNWQFEFILVASSALSLLSSCSKQTSFFSSGHFSSVCARVFGFV